MQNDSAIFESSRTFDVLSWGSPHTMCVLSSNPAPGMDGRVAVAFKPAWVAALPFHLVGLRIFVAPGLSRVMQEVLESRDPTGLTPYIVRSGASQGWVLAGGVTGKSDEGNHWSPPLFDGWGLKPGELKLFAHGTGDDGPR